MKRLVIVLWAMGTIFNCLPVLSQSIETKNTTYFSIKIEESRLGRAQNLARQAAEKANGGLSKYRAEPSMYGNPKDSPHVDNGNGTWTFTIKGGAPNDKNPTIETIVTVTKDFSKVTVDYNGPIR